MDHTSNLLQPSMQNANRQRNPQESSSAPAAAYPNPLLQKPHLNLRHNIASPTDSLMSPCTAKLQAHKNKHYIKSRPQALLSRLQNATNEQGNQTPSSS